MQPPPTDRIARAIPEFQEIFNQTFGMPGAIYIECHDGEIMRGREEAALSLFFLPLDRRPITAAMVAGRGWLGARS